jgi:hypothetical protein
VSRTIEIDYEAKSVRHWARSARGRSGPFGPYNAEISQDKVSWVESNRDEKLLSATNYTLDRKKKTLDIKVSYPDAKGWQRLGTSCERIK